MAALMLVVDPGVGFAKGYSSGGHSYSSHSSSSSGHSFSSGGSRSYSSGSGKSYSSGSSQRSSSSGKSYSSGSSHSYSQASSSASSSSSSRSRQSAYASPSRPGSGNSGMTFDTGAARAMKESASKRDFTDYQRSQSGGSSRSSSYTGPVPPVIPRARGWTARTSSPYYHTTTVWYPDPYAYSTRTIRVHNYFAPYWSRPVVVYHDNYSSLFWWWLLDQSLEDRAMWVYNHRADMDDARYRALVYQDMALENRVAELEQRQAPRDPNYVPAGMDRDLMYTDNYVNQAYASRPTQTGRMLFWFILVPTAISVGGFFIWLVFFKRWHSATA